MENFENIGLYTNGGICINISEYNTIYDYALSKIFTIDDNIIKSIGFSKTENTYIIENSNIISFTNIDFTVSRYKKTQDRYWLEYKGNIVNCIIRSMNELYYLLLFFMYSEVSEYAFNRPV